MQAFATFRDTKFAKFTQNINSTYTRYRDSVPARTITSQAEYAENFTNWETNAPNFCGTKRNTAFGPTIKLPKRPATVQLTGDRTIQLTSQRTVMFQRNGETVFDTQAPRGTTIQAVQFTASARKEYSRLNLIVCPEFCGMPLQEKLSPFGVDPNGVVLQWKVMNPKLGLEGPESAVMYLGEPLNGPSVWQLISNLKDSLVGKLIPLQSAPWGHIELAPGIYGFDLPDGNLERNILEQTSDSSAGRTISAIICKAAWDAAEWLYHGTGSTQARALLQKTGESEEECVKNQMELVLEALHWELVD